MRIKAVVAYDGGKFFGFQSQKSGVATVADTLERALRRLGVSSRIVGSGRTDRGVHATGQVIHFDLPPHWHGRLERFYEAFNAACGPAIAVRRLMPVPSDFHARFDAKRRLYRYVIKTERPLTPFEAPYALYKKGLDSAAFCRAMKPFEGEHDFALFHKKGSDPSTTVRRVFRCDCYRHGPFLIALVEADAFLRAQVRMIVQAALDVAQGRLTTAQIKEQLDYGICHTRRLAPPHGLYLARVRY